MNNKSFFCCCCCFAVSDPTVIVAKLFSIKFISDPVHMVHRPLETTIGKSFLIDGGLLKG